MYVILLPVWKMVSWWFNVPHLSMTYRNVFLADSFYGQCVRNFVRLEFSKFFFFCFCYFHKEKKSRWRNIRRKRQSELNGSKKFVPVYGCPTIFNDTIPTKIGEMENFLMVLHPLGINKGRQRWWWFYLML